MQTFQGFRPFKDMIDSGRLSPSTTISVSGTYTPRGTNKKVATAEEYSVLGREQHGKHVVYAVQRGNFPYNARNLLRSQEWHIKEA